MLPTTWFYPGLPGAYIGHIKPNQSFVFEHQTSRSLDGR
jgi:hypothetical protein